MFMDNYKSKFQSELFNSLWIAAWGDQYLIDIQPYSSCTRELLRQLELRMSVDNQSSILDLGCGTGGLSIWLSKKFGCQGTGVDCSLSAIEIAKNRADQEGLSGLLKFHVGRFENTGIYNQVFDAAVSVDALPFAADPDLALDEVYRLLKPNGQLLFTLRNLSPNSRLAIKFGPAWEKVLVRNGFQLVDVHKRVGCLNYGGLFMINGLKIRMHFESTYQTQLLMSFWKKQKLLEIKLNDERDWLLVLAKKSGIK